MTTYTIWKDKPVSFKQDIWPPVAVNLGIMLLVIIATNIISLIYPNPLTALLATFSPFVLGVAISVWLLYLFIYFIHFLFGLSTLYYIKSDIAEVEVEDEELETSEWAKKLGHTMRTWLGQEDIEISIDKLEKAQMLIELMDYGFSAFFDQLTDKVQNGLVAGGRMGIGFAVALIFFNESGVKVESIVTTHFSSFMGSIVALTLVNIMLHLLFGYEADDTETIETEYDQDDKEVIVQKPPELDLFLNFVGLLSETCGQIVSLIAIFFFATYPVRTLTELYSTSNIYLLLSGIVGVFFLSFIIRLFGQIGETKTEVNLVSVEWRISHYLSFATLCSMILIGLIYAFLPVTLFQALAGQLISAPIGAVLILSLITSLLSSGDY